MTQIREVLKGLRCEECYPRAFGEIVDDSPENLYVYNCLGGSTRCFCKKHMGYFNKDGAMKDFGDEGAIVGFGAKLVSELLEEFDALVLNSETEEGQ